MQTHEMLRAAIMSSELGSLFLLTQEQPTDRPEVRRQPVSHALKLLSQHWKITVLKN